MAFRVDSGTYRYCGELQEKIGTIDEGGGRATEWRTIEAELWMNITPLNSFEQSVAMQLRPETTHRIEIRYYEGFKTDWRIRYDGRIYSITGSINVNLRKRKMILDCIERSDKEQQDV